MSKMYPHHFYVAIHSRPRQPPKTRKIRGPFLLLLLIFVLSKPDCDSPIANVAYLVLTLSHQCRQNSKCWLDHTSRMGYTGRRGYSTDCRDHRDCNKSYSTAYRGRRGYSMGCSRNYRGRTSRRNCTDRSRGWYLAENNWRKKPGAAAGTR